MSAALVLVAIGAAVGAPLRYLVDRAVAARYRGRFPWGTFAVNVAGSLVLGALAGAATAVPQPVVAAVGTGFCGALTTYSTFSYEIVTLADTGHRRVALGYLTASLVVGLAAAAGAWAIAAALVTGHPGAPS